MGPHLIEDTDQILLRSGGEIICKFNCLTEAFITYLSLHYLVDMDYPPSLNVALTILSFLVFGEEKAPEDILKHFHTVWLEFCDFKHAES